MECRKCGEQFPSKIWIDGKLKNLQKRKYCLICSPFGEHNTRKLHVNPDRICLTCQRPMKQMKGSKCWSCASRASRKRHADDLYRMMGDCCWICGYNKCRMAMDYHHVDPKQKLFELTVREMQLTWSSILAEARKCVLLCCRCHREYHGGLISKEEMDKLYRDRWEEIDKTGFVETFVCKKTPKYICKACGKQSFNKDYCSVRCSSFAARKVERPTKEQLADEIANMTWVALGKKYGVSDNAVKKWARRYGILSAA